MIVHTLRNISVPINAPTKMPTVSPDMMYPSSTTPVRKVIIAAQRNHHRALGTSFVKASTLASLEAAAMYPPCTKLK